MLAPTAVLADETSSETRLHGASPASAPADEQSPQPNSSLISLADFASLRQAAFTRLRTAAPDSPIAFAALLREIEKIRSERA
jgi:hypothetical protein